MHLFIKLNPRIRFVYSNFFSWLNVGVTIMNVLGGHEQVDITYGGKKLDGTTYRYEFMIELLSDLMICFSFKQLTELIR